jgi:hypothetical protein
MGAVAYRRKYAERRPSFRVRAGCEPRPAAAANWWPTAGKLTAGLLTLTGGEGDVTHGEQMAYTLPAVAYGSGKPKRAPPPEPLPLAEARLSQVEAELRLMLVEAEVSRLEGRLSHLEAELADLRNARADDASPISPMLAASPDAYIEELCSGTSGSLRPSVWPSFR